MRTTVSHRHTKPLGRAHHHISSQFAGRTNDSESQQVRRHHHLGSVVVSLGDGVGVVEQLAVSGGVLEEHSADILLRVVEGLVVTHDGLNAQAIRTCEAHVNGLWVAQFRD